jgi:hypothetical protein
MQNIMIACGFLTKKANSWCFRKQMVQAHVIDFEAASNIEIVAFNPKNQDQKAFFLRIGAGDSPRSVAEQLQLVEKGHLTANDRLVKLARKDRELLTKLLEFAERESDLDVSASIAVVSPGQAPTGAASNVIPSPSSEVPSPSEQPTNILEENGIDMEDPVVFKRVWQALFGITVSRKSRSATFEHPNGGDGRVLFVPDSKTMSGSEDTAKRTRWIHELLRTPEERRNFFSFCAKNFSEDYMGVGEEVLNVQYGNIVIPTVQTESIRTKCDLSQTKMNTIRAMIKHLSGGRVRMQYKKQELCALESANPLIPIGSPTPKVAEPYEHDYDGNKYEKAESVYVELKDVVEYEADCKLQLLSGPTCFDYHSPGELKRPPGIEIVTGGDHGDPCFRMLTRLHFTSPQERKEMGVLSGATNRMIAVVECRKDNYDVLLNTCMEPVNRGFKELRTGCLIVVHVNLNWPLKKSFLVDKNIDLKSARFDIRDGPYAETSVMQYTAISPEGHATEHSITLPAAFNAVCIDDLLVFKLVSCFNEIWVGDLKFIGTLMGQNNSDSSWCPFCTKQPGNFGSAVKDDELRSMCGQCSLLSQHHRNLQERKRLQRKTLPKNHLGVNLMTLIEGIDPNHVVLPSLHCAMGQCNKVAEALTNWVLLEVEPLQGNQKAVRDEYYACLDKEQSSQNTKAALDEAKSKTKEARHNYNEMQKERKLNKGSFEANMEQIYYKWGARRQHFHGGSFNGKSCLSLMTNAGAFFDDVKLLVLEMMEENGRGRATEQEVAKKLSNFDMMFGLLDVIWSSARGVESGLLPTPEQIEQLSADIQLAKECYLSLGLNITQNPKAHLVFDGHLVRQIRMHGGLADKSEDGIELAHQIWRKLGAPTVCIKSLGAKYRQQFQTHHLENSPAIQAILNEIAEKRRRKFRNENRAQLVKEKESQIREEKMGRRGYYRGLIVA